MNSQSDKKIQPSQSSRGFFAVWFRGFVRFMLACIIRIFYRLRVRGLVNLPRQGGCLLVCNHISWMDTLILGAASPRCIRYIAFDENLKVPVISWISRVFEAIPINSAMGPKAMLAAFKTAREAMHQGDVVLIFAEGAISRTGQLLTFQRGMTKILDGIDVPVIPMYLDQMWGSIFSFRGGKFFKKWPEKWGRRQVTVTFGEPVPAASSPFQIRQAVQQLGTDSWESRKSERLPLACQFIRNAKRTKRELKVVDSLHQKATSGELLLRSLVLAKVLRREYLTRDEKFVGVLLPPSVGGVTVNAALGLLNRVAVNLNYTLTSKDLNDHIRVSGIKRVFTSQKFYEKVNIPLDTEIVFLEDLKPKVGLGDKLWGAIATYALPAFVVEWILGVRSAKPDDPLTIIFTSGSTGEPKGVVLTQNNVGSNIEAIDDALILNSEDAILGILPFFHSFGFTVCLWTILTLRPKGVYHFNPLEARIVGKLCHDEKVTILLSTPTFLRTYIKRCEKVEFSRVRLAVTGAEKLPKDVADAFEEKFGLRPREGYGTTELSPVVSVNIPDFCEGNYEQIASKVGTVGRPLAGVSARVVDPDTWEVLDVDMPGMLLIKGPNVMPGYLNMPEKTASVLRDGWYTTGDIARIDNDGFIQITDRQSRFSKIGGEMVPHIKIEELLMRILSTDNAEDGMELRAVVTAVSDERKGERLIVLHKELTKPIDQVIRELADSGLPNLWIPSSDSFLKVDEFPVLGTGKLDLKGVKAVAIAHFACKA